MSGVLCSGNIVLDVLVRPVDAMKWGASVWVDSIERGLGGNGASTAYTLGVLGIPVRLIGRVGLDDFGDSLLAMLRAAGVDTSLVARSQAATAATVALVKSDGERMFLHQPGASLAAFPEPLEFSADIVGRCTHYHLGSPFALPLQRPHLGETLRRARVAGLTTSLDTQWDSRGKWMQDLAPALPHTGILFMNEDEARLLTGMDDPALAARAVRDRGVHFAVMKLSRRGCAVFGPDLEVHEPAFDVPVVDTTGAGDCFAGGYLCALQRGESHAEAARFANAVAALSIQKMGAVAGLSSYEDTRRQLADLTAR